MHCVSGLSSMKYTLMLLVQIVDTCNGINNLFKPLGAWTDDSMVYVVTQLAKNMGLPCVLHIDPRFRVSMLLSHVYVSFFTPSGRVLHVTIMSKL